MKMLVLCGSRNPEGQTAKTAQDLMHGVIGKNGQAEIVLLPTLAIERCRQCDDSGWGICIKEGKCIIEDDFAGLVERVKGADVVAFATPVYFSDLSESMRAFLDRLRRTCCNEVGRASIADKQAIGICVAGGGGGGAPACCASLDKVLATCGFNVVDLIPVRRQNLIAKLGVLKAIGEWLAQGASE
jgi:multimeric flavodoxin WrbA